MLTRREFTAVALAPASKEMVLLPGGTFRVGASAAALKAQFPNAGRGLQSMLEAETPPHEMKLDAFWVDRYEVTNAEYQRFVRARKAWKKGVLQAAYLAHWNGDEFPKGQGDFPVTYITWDAAVAYARWAGKRLLSEAEWEFAARGGKPESLYPWGTEEPAPSVAVSSQSRVNGPVRVGSCRPNPYGIFDLAGNVWEFCSDVWRPRYDAPPDTQGARRVIRGGSFEGGAFNMRITARDSHRENDPVPHVGFRCGRSA